MNANAWRALAAATILVVMTAGSTATSALFVIYRIEWGLSSADIAIVFSAYVGTLLPVLLFFGDVADRVGRRTAIVTGITFMAAGLIALLFAQNLPVLLVARLLQGIGVGLGIGAVSAAFAESYRGSAPWSNVLQVGAAVGLAAGPMISAIAFNLGGGLHLSYLPALVLVVALLALMPLVVQRNTATAAQPDETPLPPTVVWRALAFALPLVFVSWASLSLYLSLVPAYLAATLHAVNPLIGAAAVLAAQLASIAATLRFMRVAPERSGIVAPIVMIGGLVLLVLGTSANLWLLVGLGTILVGAGGGVSSAAAFGIAGRVGGGQRARIFSRMFVAAYLGYSIPALSLGAIAAHWSFTAGFVTIIIGLAAVTATLPVTRARMTPQPCPRRELAAA